MTRHRIIGLFLFALFAQTSIGQIWTHDFERNGLGRANTSPLGFPASSNAQLVKSNGAIFCYAINRNFKKQIFKSAYLGTPIASSCNAVIKPDDIVGVEDLLIFISQYGSTCN